MTSIDLLAERASQLVATLTARPRTSGARVVNDIHSRLNPTRVARIVDVRSVEDAREAIRVAGRENRPVCIGGGWHAMGGQQFVAAGALLDTRAFRGVLGFDRERGLVEVEAGIQWPELIAILDVAQRDLPPGATRWAIAQKQTGADRLSIGGALSANVHGRGLAMRPFVADVESFTLVNAAGAVVRCSRTENVELFRLAIGGYGLFGFVATVTLRLVPRRKLRRVVEVIDATALVAAFESRIADGFLYGDFQFAIDPASADFLHRGIFSTYQPLDDDSAIDETTQRALTPEQWRTLLLLAHIDRTRAFELYAEHYLATSGQLYWSDTHQLSTYIDDYHEMVDAHLAARGQPSTGSEMITELFVPRPALPAFLAAARDGFRRDAVELIYGTIRLIERDDETFLPWARDRSACVIFNLHVAHTEPGLAAAETAFRDLIDHAIACGGSYYLTYHRWARRDQVLACHPRLPEMLRLKQGYDPAERFQSEWYRWYRDRESELR